VVNGVTTHDESNLVFDLQLGSIKIPQTPCASQPECFSLLRQAVGIYDQTVSTINIDQAGYSANNFLIGIGLQTVPGAAFSGLSSRAGDLLSIKAKNLATDRTVNAPARAFVMLVSEQICEIRENGVSVLD